MDCVVDGFDRITILGSAEGADIIPVVDMLACKISQHVCGCGDHDEKNNQRGRPTGYDILFEMLSLGRSRSPDSLVRIG